MDSRIVFRAVQLTPQIVILTGLLIAIVLSLYWAKTKHVDLPGRSPGCCDDAELVLLMGLLLIAVGVTAGFVLLLVLSTSTIASP